MTDGLPPEIALPVAAIAWIFVLFITRHERIARRRNR